MTKDEIRSVLDTCLPTESPGFRSPTEFEWRTLENQFSCRLPSEMRDFIDLMAEYAFPGDILNVGAGPNNANDTIEVAYNLETRKNPNWVAEMIPFYSIGNGDYFCVSSLQCSNSPVFYNYAECGKFENYSESFEKWVLELPHFLT